MKFPLRPGWYSEVIDGRFDFKSCGVYEWRIGEVSVYLGRARKLRDGISRYPWNVGRMLRGLPWHGNPDRDYRPIHHALRRAYEDERPVSVSVLENCHSMLCRDRAKYWIERRREEALVGGPLVLNSN